MTHHDKLDRQFAAWQRDLQLIATEMPLFEHPRVMRVPADAVPVRATSWPVQSALRATASSKVLTRAEVEEAEAQTDRLLQGMVAPVPLGDGSGGSDTSRSRSRDWD